MDMMSNESLLKNQNIIINYQKLLNKDNMKKGFHKVKV